MTRADIAALENLFAKRVKILEKIEHLGKTKTENLECGSRLADHNWHTFYLPRGYVGAQWVAELVDIERRIRAAGGTL